MVLGAEIDFSVIMPSYNEATRIEMAVKIVEELFGNKISYELIIVDDGSTDETESVVKRLLSSNKKIRYLKNEINQGRGFSINRGYSAAQGNYLMVVQGKLDTTVDQLRKLIEAANPDMVVLSYPINQHDRQIWRQVLSYLFTLIINVSFGKKIKYYNGTSVTPRKYYSDIKLTTSSYAFDAEFLLKMFKKKIKYIEIPVVDVFEKGRRSRAFTLRNLTGVILFYFRMLKYYYL